MTASRIIPATGRDAAIASLARMLAHFLPGKELTVTVEEAKPERSDKQRAALFGVAYKALMQQMGLSGEREKERLHEALCGEYFGWRDVDVMGRITQVPVRTTTTGPDGKRDVISMAEQLDFYAWIQRKAAEFGYDIPDPDPLWRIRAELDEELEGRCP